MAKRGPGSHGPGLFAEDAAAALRQRAEWEAQLGAGALLCSDDLSDASSEWEDDGNKGGSSPRREEDDAPANRDKRTPDDKPPSDPVRNGLDAESMGFGSARECFVKLTSSGAVGVKKDERVEALPQRLQRIRAEVGTLVTLVEAHKKEAATAAKAGGGGLFSKGGGAAPSSPPAVEEAARLGREAKDLELHMKWAASADPAAGTGDGAARLWLPPSERGDFAVARHLLELSRLPGGRAQQQAAAGAAGSANGHYYQLTCVGNWHAGPEAELLQGLEARVQQLRGAIGEGAAGPGDSLTGVARQLHGRLECLQQVWDDSACEHLRSSARLLSADIGAAAAEAERLKGLEDEESETNFGDVVSESPEEQISRLHAHVAGIDAVASRTAEVDRQLKAQERASAHLTRFGRDLHEAEERIRHAKEVLTSVSQATQKMRDNAIGSRKQLLQNLAILKKKVPQKGILNLGGDDGM